MANRFFNPASQWFDSDGLPLVGGTLTFYLTGGTTTPSAPFSDWTLTTPTANPMTLDDDGRAPTELFLDPAITYRVVCKNAAGDVEWSRDPVVDPAANITAAFRIYNGNPNGNVAGNQGVLNGIGASVIWDTSSDLIWVCTTTGTTATAVWVQVGATLVGAVSFSSVITPTAIAASPQADYSPTNMASAAFIRQDVSLTTSISGLATGSTGRYVVWENISAYTHTFLDQNTGSAAANRFAIGFDYKVYPGQSAAFWYDSSSLRWRLVGSPYNMPFTTPGGRLTLASSLPVMTADVTAAASVIYTPYLHSFINLPNGAGSWYSAVFAEYSQALSDTTKSPAATAVSTAYDVLVWNDAGTIRATRNFPWSAGGGSLVARGTGAGSAELVRDSVNGVYTNKYAVTNGPAAGMGVYVGSFVTNAGNAVDWVCNPAAAAGGGNARANLWNNYNRVMFSATSKDSTDNWTSSGVANTYRAANANNNNRITLFMGLDEGIVVAHVKVSLIAISIAGNSIYTGIGLDSVTVASGLPSSMSPWSGAAGDIVSNTAQFNGSVGLGSHFLQWIEATSVATLYRFYGDNGGALLQSGISATFMA